MNKLEKKFYEYFDNQILYTGDWRRTVAQDLAKIAYKNSDERAENLKEMYNAIGKLCIKLDRENAELKKKLG